MKCVICKHGETRPGEVTVTLERNGVTLVIKHVPASVCTNGGAGDEAFRETRRIFRGTRTKTYGKGLEDLAGRLDALLAHLA